MEKSLSELIIGDKCFLTNGRTAQLGTVSRITPTQIVCAIPNYIGQSLDRRFNKETGREIGDSHSGKLKAWTPELEEFFAQRKRYTVVNLIFPAVSEKETERVNRIYKFLQDEGLS